MRAPDQREQAALGRPVGEVREVLVRALREQGPMAVRDLAAATQVGYDAARWTLKRCVASGELVKAGFERRAHAKNWVAIYDVAEPAPDEPPAPGLGWVDLSRCIQGWAR
jgi:hypothetical protein